MESQDIAAVFREQNSTLVSQYSNFKEWPASIISPYNISPESNIKAMRTKEMITK